MDSSPVLCQQSPHKIHRMKNEHNKKQTDLTSSKHKPAPHLSKKNIENKDPGSTEISKKVPMQPCISRIPVMAKSLRLQTSSEFSQSHHRWEEKPLAIKAKKKKSSTRPVPFNLSEHRNTGIASKNQHPLSVLQSRSGTENNICKIKPAKPQAVLTSNGNSSKDKGKLSQADEHKAPQRVACTSVMKSRQKDDKSRSVHFTLDPGALQSILQNEGVKAATPRSSICPSGRNTSVYSAQRMPVRRKCAEGAGVKTALKDTPSKTWTPQTISTIKQQPPSAVQEVVQKLFDDKEDEQSQINPSKGQNVQSDHAALLSLLQIKAQSVTSGTPQSKPYDSLPQRVPVKKSRQIEGPAVSVKSVNFSPDPGALQSILQNEGVKATPRGSVCPSGRNTSVYSAQRVPVKKNRAEAPGAAAVALKETPSKKWTPQRVPNTKHQPMSAMKLHLPKGPSLFGSPALRSCKSVVQPQQKEIVQTLFDDKEDEQRMKVTDQDLDSQAEQLPVKSSVADLSNSDEEEQKFVGGQTFLQAPHRESVIFFSTGKKLFRAPRIDKQEDSAQQDQKTSSSSLDENDDEKSEPATQTSSSVQPLQRDPVVHKPCSQVSAAAMLRKRFPPLEELLLDEEVATYTSLSAPVNSPPAWPRCGNPLASILHFEESTRFVPISIDSSSGPGLQER